MGKLVEIKTKATEASVEEFINTIEDEVKRKDSFTILEMMKQASNESPKMWGSSMVGFGLHRYKSPATGREVDWFKIGFSPRKANLSLHLINLSQHQKLLEQLGKFKTGAGCLYIKQLKDVDVNVLNQIIKDALIQK